MILNLIHIQEVLWDFLFKDYSCSFFVSQVSSKAQDVAILEVIGQNRPVLYSPTTVIKSLTQIQGDQHNTVPRLKSGKENK